VGLPRFRATGAEVAALCNYITPAMISRTAA
jgi:hypothetical protein